MDFVRAARASLATLAFLLCAVPTWACFDVSSPPDAMVRFITANTAEVTVSSLVARAPGLGGTDECAVGLAYPNPAVVISGVTAAVAVDDDEPPNVLSQFAFAPNANTTNDLNALALPGLQWNGFHTTLGGTVMSGTVVNIVFTVSLNGTPTYDDIRDELADFALVASDDAVVSGGGTLAGTSQEVEGIVTFTETEDCYDDVIGPGEICDGANEMGCNVGELCILCSQCVVPNFGNICKAGTIKSLSLHAKGDFKCYTKAAKLGQPVDNNCLSAVKPDLTLYWLKLDATYQGNNASCPFYPLYPSDVTANGDIAQLASDVDGMLPYNLTSGSRKCSEKKTKAASLWQANTLKCHLKALKTNMPVVPLCLTKVDTKYNQAFARAELPAQCDAGNVGNAAAVRTRLDTYVNLLLALP